MQLFVNELWYTRQPVLVVARRLNFFVFRFYAEEDMDHAISRGPWLIRGGLLVLDYWHFYNALEHIKVRRFSMWVQLHNLPFEAFTREPGEILRQALAEEVTVFVDDVFPRQFRYLHVCISLTPETTLVLGFFLEIPDGQPRWIECRYERLYKFCRSCGRMGHTYPQCDLSREEARARVDAMLNQLLVFPTSPHEVGNDVVGLHVEAQVPNGGGNEQIDANTFEHAVSELPWIWEVTTLEVDVMDRRWSEWESDARRFAVNVGRWCGINDPVGLLTSELNWKDIRVIVDLREVDGDLIGDRSCNYDEENRVRRRKGFKIKRRCIQQNNANPFGSRLLKCPSGGCEGLVVPKRKGRLLLREVGALKRRSVSISRSESLCSSSSISDSSTNSDSEHLFVVVYSEGSSCEKNERGLVASFECVNSNCSPQKRTTAHAFSAEVTGETDAEDIGPVATRQRITEELRQNLFGGGAYGNAANEDIGVTFDRGELFQFIQPLSALGIGLSESQIQELETPFLEEEV
ncbi:hypothetical protein Vadar_034767 [Vaccinium darrowii]|uniref:Uncharacterized protein n=1 Tax=Vaccinium darrowii TaxID=229202 RepID=A0ACB7XEB0_9ERIC|nr:hypothetical protein Vadar_034767 [Vaccinium darrowii]